jgi:predicted transcriptional regulator
VELRRKRLPSNVSHVVVYATSPLQRIVGWFEVDSVEHDRPSRLWERHGPATGVSAREFKTYFHGAQEGTAISVGRTVSLRKPLALSTLWRSSPPQSFGYLDTELATRRLGLRRGRVGRSPGKLSRRTA